MSLRDYYIADEIDKLGASFGEDFYALIMVAMKNADTDNQAKLQAAWPEVWAELEQRYNAPQGLLVGEHTRDGWTRTEAGLFDPDGKLVRAVWPDLTRITTEETK